MISWLKKFWKDENGQGMVEYGLILALVAIVVIVALSAVGGGLKGIFQEIAKTISGSTSVQ
ncbi:MAG: Flp family type IVb pilin [Thermanaeromonas sp.]|uniref:Flp family type IVb pilin n=1 Tax=Thermanaeromonas sp. TaxID=2003697 RepID=UPI002439649A|nr:Flp family type IVb pilin [Thermanaeromonas sp.]MCG0278067.1 Flp family type IVb pilin [Thermanaeromonas sp.]